MGPMLTTASILPLAPLYLGVEHIIKLQVESYEFGWWDDKVTALIQERVFLSTKVIRFIYHHA